MQDSGSIAVRDTKAAARKARIGYIVWWVVMPPVAAALTFGVLCAFECTALPWATFYLAPLAVAALAIVAGVVYWSWAKSLPDPDRRSTRTFIYLSALWGPAAALAGVALLVLGAQLVATLLALS